MSTSELAINLSKPFLERPVGNSDAISTSGTDVSNALCDEGLGSRYSHENTFQIEEGLHGMQSPSWNMDVT